MKLNVKNEKAITILYDHYCEVGLEDEADEIQDKILKDGYSEDNNFSNNLIKNIIYVYFYERANKLNLSNKSRYCLEDEIEDRSDYLVELSSNVMKRVIDKMIKNVREVM